MVGSFVRWLLLLRLKIPNISQTFAASVSTWEKRTKLFPPHPPKQEDQFHCMFGLDSGSKGLNQLATCFTIGPQAAMDYHTGLVLSS